MKFFYILLIVGVIYCQVPTEAPSGLGPTDLIPTDLIPTLGPTDAPIVTTLAPTSTPTSAPLAPTDAPKGLSPIFTGNGTINFKNKSDVIAVSVVSGVVLLIIISVVMACCCGCCGGKYKNRRNNKCSRGTCCRRQNQVHFHDGKIEAIDLDMSD